MRKIFVVDPGMMEAGGHHAALLSTLTSYEDVGNKNITLITHKQIDTSLAKIATNNNVKVVAYFLSNFYEHYGSILGLKDPSLQSYVRTLAIEYLALFQWIASEESAESKLTFFYPCLNWEHAFALNLSLSYVATQQSTSLINVQHKVCCMFTPKNQKAPSETLLYKQAFKSLSRQSNVELYASDFETQLFYKKLGLPMLGIHPCYLLPWEQITRTSKPEGEKPQILLYLGDAKESKGFNELPNLATKLLEEYKYEVTLVVQYTLAWDYPELKQSMIDLDKLSAKCKQLKVYKEFWSPDRLVHELTHVDIIYCTYCPNAYRNKSSGLAWLASFFAIPVVVDGECWITREFERLRHEYKFYTDVTMREKSEHAEIILNDYSRSLFSNLISWIDS